MNNTRLISLHVEITGSNLGVDLLNTIHSKGSQVFVLLNGKEMKKVQWKKE